MVRSSFSIIIVWLIAIAGLMGIISCSFDDNVYHINPGDVIYRFSEKEDSITERYITFSDSGLYIGIIGDSLDFSNRIWFGRKHDVICSSGYGIYECSSDSITAIIYPGRVQTLKFKIIDKENIELFEVYGIPQKRKYVFFNFGMPIKVGINQIRRYRYLWDNENDFENWLKNNNKKEIIPKN